MTFGTNERNCFCIYKYFKASWILFFLSIQAMKKNAILLFANVSKFACASCRNTVPRISIVPWPTIKNESTFPAPIGLHLYSQRFEISLLRSLVFVSGIRKLRKKKNIPCSNFQVIVMSTILCGDERYRWSANKTNIEPILQAFPIMNSRFFSIMRASLSRDFLSRDIIFLETSRNLVFDRL